MTLKNLNIDKTWTLFLDRDGVINEKLQNDYVKGWHEFRFIEGSPDALKKLSMLFGKIIVVTNQQGIGKGIYTESDLARIHNQMMEEIIKQEGRIDRIYFSPHLAAMNHPHRKPGIGMALEAKKEFPDIDFSKSIIVGDSMSDMKFGKDAGMITVYISGKQVSDPLIDHCFLSLLKFSEALQ
jgi:D-glycero-D-manno-heptose 1,7-bisphosphate phosphatase